MRSRQPVSFDRCPICGENIPLRSLFGIWPHLRAVHRQYWKWALTYAILTTIFGVGWIVFLFVLMILDIIPARTPTERTGIGIAVWVILAISIVGIMITYRVKGGKKFKQQWLRDHPPQQRTYGNLHGIEASVKLIVSKRDRALLSLEPASIVAQGAIALLAKMALGKVKLDKFENGIISLYDNYDTLTQFQTENPQPTIIDEQRLRVKLKKGQLEIRIKNPLDLNRVVSLLSSERSTGPHESYMQ